MDCVYFVEHSVGVDSWLIEFAGCGGNKLFGCEKVGFFSPHWILFEKGS